MPAELGDGLSENLFFITDFDPPSIFQFFFKIDALRGCGDLMFSSHTIYTLSLILSVCKNWPHPLLIGFMISVQVVIAFLIVAARKHYSIDVFTALYVVPMIWFLLDAYMHDINHKDVIITPKVIHDFYGIDVSEMNGTEVDSHPSTQLESAHVTLIEEGRLRDQEMVRMDTNH
ncbi:unnamed protein product [Albugo candida]|uniref:Sphingomyelin synthase-like domain-containing protein n=1 Tax=Albugo candida TaxID=65357 RepID=A0A024G1Q3_9STRA|nr:unnamed protein product [Albugo candida]|eukprot:CCI40466.1 unnamed protein product [Albugo candida]